MKDTFSTVSIFSKLNGVLPTKDFYDVIKFIESKGSLKMTINKNRQNKIDITNDIILIHHIDTRNDKFVTQKFIFKNATSTSCIFRSTVPLSGTKNYFPGFVFSQWNFANNLERDSAYKIMNWVYFGGYAEYEKKYNQTVIGDKRLYLIEPNAKIFEQIGIQYAKYLNQYLAGQKNNSR